MIDWLFVLCHAFWIAGAAVMVAAWSYSRAAGSGGTARIAITAGALLFCIGLALVTPLWLAAMWAALAFFASYETWQAIQTSRQHL
ncbi:MAG TPA: hypothetical protein VH087_19995 [Thermoanaerobaculia bacterium]|jgi:hypothetical protein|nr:hypothetical protein [Thermoanaerobaculia bacterium]